MANKQALRDLQSRLAERLQAARTEARAQVVAGGRVRLRAASCFRCAMPARSSPVAPMVPVPHSHRWFLGVVEPARPSARRRRPGGVPGREERRAQRATRRAWSASTRRSTSIACCSSTGCPGLRSEEELTPRADDGDAAARVSRAARYRDASSRVWQELNLAALAGDEAFLRHRRLRRPGADRPVDLNESERGHMRFLNKIKGWGQKGDADSTDSSTATIGVRRAPMRQPGAVAFRAPARRRSPTPKRPPQFDSMPPAHADGGGRLDHLRGRCRPRRADFTETAPAGRRRRRAAGAPCR